jgi:hypothetical protein
MKEKNMSKEVSISVKITEPGYTQKIDKVRKILNKLGHVGFISTVRMIMLLINYILEKEKDE